MRLKKFTIYSLIFVMSLFINERVFALTGTVNDTYVRIRSGAGTSYQTLLESCNQKQCQLHRTHTGMSVS